MQAALGHVLRRSGIWSPICTAAPISPGRWLSRCGGLACSGRARRRLDRLRLNWSCRRSPRTGSLRPDHRLAVERLLDWQEGLCGGGDQFPSIVTEELDAIGSDLSPAVSAVRFADPGSGRCLEFRRKEPAEPLGEQIEDALLHGWLKEVNWHDRTAQLHVGDGSRVTLCFDASLDWEMLRLATSYVEIHGRGCLPDDDDSWETVHVEQIRGTRSCREPFDLEAFQNNPNPKIFDPDKIVTFDLTDEEWETFDQAIREGRKS